MAAPSEPSLSGKAAVRRLFADHYFGFDDAIYAAVRCLGMLARNEQTPAQLVASLEQLPNTPELRLFCAEERKFAIVEELRNRMRSAGADVIDVDGVRVKTDDGWWLVRASNTQAALVARGGQGRKDVGAHTSDARARVGEERHYRAQGRRSRSPLGNHAPALRVRRTCSTPNRSLT